MNFTDVRNYQDARELLGLDREGPAFISVEQGGRIKFGYTRQASHAAAKRGDLPTVGEGRHRKVPVMALAKQLFACDAETEAA